MASVRSIRKHTQANAARARLYRRIRGVECLFQAAVDEICQKLGSAMRELVEIFQPAHIFKVGEYATRDGSDVQRVTSVTDIFADFQCILPPHTGWCEAGDVEHNAMRRYRPLSKEEAEAMIKECRQGTECKPDGTMSPSIHGDESGERLPEVSGG